jgi:hypothetical protein
MAVSRVGIIREDLKKLNKQFYFKKASRTLESKALVYKRTVMIIFTIISLTIMCMYDFGKKASYTH